AKHASVDNPFSSLKVEVTKILEKEGYIEGYRVVEGSPRATIKIALRCGSDGDRVINGLTRVSRPGRRVYCSKDEIPKVLGGLGISIISTSQGLLSGAEGRKRGVGGEVVCTVW